MRRASNLLGVTLAIVCCCPLIVSADQGKGKNKKHDRAAVVHGERNGDGRPGSVLVVGEFRIATGVFVRVVVDR
jgi:hypothetical protein